VSDKVLTMALSTLLLGAPGNANWSAQLELPQSIYTGSREFHDLTPPLGFVGDELTKFGR
jgi:hypothetical protein